VTYKEWLEELELIMSQDGDESRVDMERARKSWHTYSPQEFYEELVAKDPEAETIDLRYEL
jgi:hypothetical protein